MSFMMNRLIDRVRPSDGGSVKRKKALLCLQSAKRMAGREKSWAVCSWVLTTKAFAAAVPRKVILIVPQRATISRPELPQFNR